MSTYRYMGRARKNKLRILRLIHGPELTRVRAETQWVRRARRANRQEKTS